MVLWSRRAEPPVPALGLRVDLRGTATTTDNLRERAIPALEDNPLEIIGRDERLAVLAKPAGISLLADRAEPDCLWNQLPERLGSKPYLVHRLDKGTSGVLLVALDQRTQSTLTRAFNRRTVRKYYLAWVVGQIDGPATRLIDLPLRPGRKSRYRVAGQRSAIRQTAAGWTLDGPTDPQGRPSSTRMRVLLPGPKRSLVLLQPLTGRTHQLRVHMAWIGHPILGDHLYGRPGAPEQAAERLQLHCHRLVVPGWGSFRTRPDADWLDAPSR
jgi:tRNA pseudouridine32 synthase/23S rRNA pseudouridine746 synthase/23S rRNA pseudouridine1911/1915/1917 synthase